MQMSVQSETALSKFLDAVNQGPGTLSGGHFDQSMMLLFFEKPHEVATYLANRDVIF
jgi:hypothetical protein